MIGCQSMIFIAMLEYGYILYQVKFKNKISKNNMEGLDLIEIKINALDGYFLILMPFLFIIFNVIFWTRVILYIPYAISSE